MTNSHWHSSSISSTYESPPLHLPVKVLEGFVEIRSLTPELELELVRSCAALVRSTRCSKTLVDPDVTAKAQAYRTMVGFSQQNSQSQETNTTNFAPDRMTPANSVPNRRPNTSKPRVENSQVNNYIPPKRPATAKRALVPPSSEPSSSENSPTNNKFSRKASIAALYTQFSVVISSYVRPTSPTYKSSLSSSVTETSRRTSQTGAEASHLPRKSSEPRLKLSSRKSLSNMSKTKSATNPKTNTIKPQTRDGSERPMTPHISSDVRFSLMPKRSMIDLKRAKSQISSSTGETSPSSIDMFKKQKTFPGTSTQHVEQAKTSKALESKTSRIDLRKHFPSFLKRKHEIQAF